MKRSLMLVLSAAVITLFLAAFSSGVTYASTSCFNDTSGNWAETFICWMKEKGISTGFADGGYHPGSYVTRAEMAVFLKRQAEIPPSQGEVYISSSLNLWTTNGMYNDGYIQHESGYVFLSSPGSGVKAFSLIPDLPSSLYGRQLLLRGVNICYDATHGASINLVEVAHWNGGPNPSYYNYVDDGTSRTDSVCRVYTFPFDGAFWGVDHASVYMSVNFNSSDNYVKIGAVSFIMVPSDISSILPYPMNNAMRPSLDMP